MNRKEINPEVNMGCTLHVGSDYYPYTIIKVINEKKIIVTPDIYKRIDDNGEYTEDQQYEYLTNYDGKQETYTKRKNGAWFAKGSSLRGGCPLIIGVRRAYQDPCF